ncbi:hypothetical protein VN12_18835 [Pirellula sp. SH-Sr6A]|uniref:hypothetical protein n=1 Tax=Pirellula sp. SH-Sr6A TaxID=1632865 RepID=UPI00078C1AB1|nr:hypothetical protein [Pirellula sp. SH-Sr6A]AMV34193.1 hypothetical protein VN12_18835 [Pirellula sp. SH-Sr6A]
MNDSEKNNHRETCVNASSMISIYYGDLSELAECTSVAAEQVPAPYHDLLAHTNHMTVTVEEHHGDSVDVQVLQSHSAGNHYCREILLLAQKSRLVVQYGIVRLNTSYLPDAPRDEILAQTKPLGRVLIEHDVLRKIELFHLLRVTCGPRLAHLFGVPVGTITYGRTAMLYCNHDPAIELLEIVRPAKIVANTAG